LAKAKRLALVREAYQIERGVYGAPRITAYIKKGNVRIGKNTVARLMIQLGLRAKTKKRFRPSKAPTAQNLKFSNILRRAFNPAAPGAVYAGDITYIHTSEGWLYLAIVMDLYSRKIIGWSLKDHIRTSLVTEALELAVNNIRPIPGAIHHSDRGSQYASATYLESLERHKLTPSFSDKGVCYDNAAVESFFRSLKSELVYLTQFDSKKQALAAIFEYIEVFYNRERIHSSLGYLTPHQMIEGYLKEPRKDAII
jgi:putative transposase